MFTQAKMMWRLRLKDWRYNIIKWIDLSKNGGVIMLMNNKIDFIKTIRDMSTEELMEIY